MKTSLFLLMFFALTAGARAADPYKTCPSDKTILETMDSHQIQITLSRDITVKAGKAFGRGELALVEMNHSAGRVLKKGEKFLLSDASPEGEFAETLVTADEGIKRIRIPANNGCRVSYNKRLVETYYGECPVTYGANEGFVTENYTNGMFLITELADVLKNDFSFKCKKR